jgi:hypothetical protein
MAVVHIRDDAIWLKHIEGDVKLQELIRQLAAGETLELEVGGVRGKWQRMRDGRDGRPTYGIRPLWAMKLVWAMWRSEAARAVEIREVPTSDSYLAALRALLSEWDSPEDELAYGDL